MSDTRVQCWRGQHWERVSGVKKARGDETGEAKCRGVSSGEGASQSSECAGE